MTDIQVTDHFKLSKCRCSHCHKLIFDDLFMSHMDKLELLRLEADFPVVISSGYRCKEHNKAVGGSLHSWHMKYATDIRPEDNEEHNLTVIYRIALEQEWGGIGVYGSWVHLDMRTTPVRWNKK